MKKVLCIELSYTWVLTRIDDSKYPIETIKEKLLRGNKYNVVSESYVHLTLETNESDIEKIKARVTSIFTQKYGKENLDALSFSDRDKFADDESTDISEDEDVDVEEEESAPLGDVLERIETLVGAKEFKDFVKRNCKTCARNQEKTFSGRVYVAKLFVFDWRRRRTYHISRIVCDAYRRSRFGVYVRAFSRCGNKARFDGKTCR